MCRTIKKLKMGVQINLRLKCFYKVSFLSGINLEAFSYAIFGSSFSCPLLGFAHSGQCREKVPGSGSGFFSSTPFQKTGLSSRSRYPSPNRCLFMRSHLSPSIFLKPA